VGAGASSSRRQVLARARRSPSARRSSRGGPRRPLNG
jgi:hypothetical protein